MGLLDKIKNVFFEEEYVEIEEPVERPKKIAKKIEVPEIKKTEHVVREENNNESVDENKEDSVKTEKHIERTTRSALSEREPKVESNFKFPMTFEEDDFREEKVIIEENAKELEKEKEVILREVEREYVPPVYERKKVEEDRKPVFRPTPIISPIYGILDKNYKKEEIVQKREVRISSSNRKLDVDSVRNKAYGDSAETKDPVEKQLEKVEDNDFMNEIEVNDTGLLYDLNDDSSPVVEKVTVGDAEEYFHELGLEYNVDYKDTTKEKATGRRVQKFEEKEQQMKRTSTYDDDGLESNLFDLIDSMYEEKE